MRTLVLAAVIALALPAADAAPAPQDTMQPPYLTAAINDPGRQADRADDARRKIAQVMAFAEVKPGDKVLELIPGSGYFTRVFSGVVGAKGHVYALWPNEYAAEAQSDVVNLRKLARQPHYANVSVLTQPAASLDAPESVDLVFTSQNYHDYPDRFMGKVDPVMLDRQVFKVLKPGGVFVVIDHVAPAGSGMRDTDTLHRIDPAIVRKQAESVGFVFDGQSDALRNPADPHDIKVFDKSIRGHTDQFMYRFRKPKG
ncbi:MAG TPA: class I SAM-dependent methyltransferase [Frateuria sp.]|uniref:class I SAM-dependent methyltransferase n=1 Tax=Frateuria sp. TaxID=2211372 RepID=UPI002D80D4A0|nr:class I SAM-dependent methyltransferase [Frateuria sp.]HET6806226.1 class I SAM-dependent methyltransferase [Frateuria sp.]